MNLNFWKKEESVSMVEGEATLAMHQEATLDEVGKSGMAENDNFYSRVSRWAIYLGVFMIPLFFLPYSTNVFEVNKQILLLILAGVGMVAWLLSVVSSGWLNWRNNIINWAVLALVASTLISTLFSLARLRSLFGVSTGLSSSLFSLLILAAFYFVLVNSFNDRGERVRSLLVLSLLVTLLFGLMQLVGIYIFKFPFAVSKAFNSVGTVNALGLIAAISLALFSHVRLSFARLTNLHLEKVGVVLALAVLFIINWWVLWLVAIFGMVGLIIFETISSEKFKMTRIVLPMTIIVLGVFLVIVNVNFGALSEGLPIEVAPSFGLAKDVAMKTLAEKPLWGYGPENFSFAFDKHGSSRLADTALSGAGFSDGSSYFLTLVVENGIIGIAALLFVIYCVGVSIRRYIRHSRVHEESKEDIGLLAALIAILAALFLYPFNLSHYFMLFAILGLTTLAIWKDNMKHFNIEEKAVLSLVSSLGFIAGLILVLVGAYFGGTNYLADTRYAQALTVKNNQDAAAKIVQAISLNNQDDRFYRTGSQIAINLLSETLNTKDADPNKNSKIQNYTQTAINLGRRATEVAPHDSANWANLGVVYQNLLTLVDGADQLSSDAYKKAIELKPGDASYYNRMGSIHLARYEILKALAGRTKNQADVQRLANEASVSLTRAEESFKNAITVSKNYGTAIYNLGAVYDRQGKVAEAVTELEKVLPANANQAGLLFEVGLLSYRANRKDRAHDYLQRAILLAPEYSNARWYLAFILEERGQIDQAIEQLEKIQSLEVNKTNEAVTNKLNQLKEGRKSVPPINVLDQQPL